MRRKTIISLLFLMALSINAWTQNLVPNYSFEDTIQCPTMQQFIGYVSNWTGGAQPIYFNRYCNDANTGEVPANIFGHQYPHSGSAYVGIYTFLKTTSSDTAERSYVEVKLMSALLPSVKYFVTFYVSLADTFKYACNNIGALLSDSIINCSGYITTHIPQIANNPITNPLTDKINWIKVSGSFTALGGEQYIIIGNFKDDAHSDTVFVNSTAAPGYAPAACYYLDDVIVSPDSNYADSLMGVAQLKVNSEEIKVYPNPSNGVFAVELKANSEKLKVEVYNLLGQPIYQTALTEETTQVNLSAEPKGIYLYRVITDDGNLVSQGKLIIQ